MEILNINNIKFVRNNNNSGKVVFVTGVTGQDGSHMVDYLLKNTNHIIIGGARRLSTENHINLSHVTDNDRFGLVNFDLTDSYNINYIMQSFKPDYFINFAAQSFVASSWDFPVQTWDCNTNGVINILESIRQHNPKCRFYNAGSSEEFGNVEYIPQDEKHPLKPRSPYGASKAASRLLVKVYRESYNLYAIQGLLFNHEGTRRGYEFVTRKISTGIARIKNAIDNKLSFEPIELGNLYAKRDWSDAEDFVHGVWLMLNQPSPKEYVLSSDETHTIKEFVTIGFKHVNIDASWHGSGLYEELSLNKAFVEQHDVKSSVVVKINQRYFRPAEVDLLMGNSTLARTELKWSPSTSFDKLVRKMVDHDLKKSDTITT